MVVWRLRPMPEGLNQARGSRASQCTHAHTHKLHISVGLCPSRLQDTLESQGLVAQLGIRSTQPGASPKEDEGPRDLTKGDRIGLGVGIGIGVPVLIALVVVGCALWMRKARSAPIMPTPPSSPPVTPHHGGPAIKPPWDMNTNGTGWATQPQPQQQQPQQGSQPATAAAAMTAGTFRPSGVPFPQPAANLSQSQVGGFSQGGFSQAGYSQNGVVYSQQNTMTSQPGVIYSQNGAVPMISQASITAPRSNGMYSQHSVSLPPLNPALFSQPSLNGGLPPLSPANGGSGGGAFPMTSAGLPPLQLNSTLSPAGSGAFPMMSAGLPPLNSGAYGNGSGGGGGNPLVSGGMPPLRYGSLSPSSGTLPRTSSSASQLGQPSTPLPPPPAPSPPPAPATNQQQGSPP